MISKCLRDKVFPLEDKDLLRDRQKFILHNFDYDQYKSDDIEDRRYIFHQDLRSICIMIGQLILYKRIILTDKKGIPYLPKGFVPRHLNPLKQKDYNQSTLTEMLNELKVDEEIYNEIERMVGKIELDEKTDEYALPMVRVLNTLDYEIGKANYKKQLEYGKRNPKQMDKVIKVSRYLIDVVKKMR